MKTLLLRRYVPLVFAAFTGSMPLLAQTENPTWGVGEVIDLSPDSTRLCNNITFYPVSLLHSTLKLGFERVVSEKWTMKLTVAYTKAEYNFLYGEDLSGHSVELQARRFFGNGGARKTGMFGGLFAQNKALHYTKVTTSNNYSWFGNSVRLKQPKKMAANAAGVLMGARVYTFSNITVDGYFGGGMCWSMGENKEGYMLNYYESGVFPTLGFSIGYGF